MPNFVNTIDDYFKEGILIQAFQAERNLFIWNAISGEISFLEKQPKEIKELYSFIQDSASTNFILHTAKLFDSPRNYPTRCIIAFLEKIKNWQDPFPKIEETTLLENLLKTFQTSEMIDMINSVKNDDTSEFPMKFTEYYEKKLKSLDIQTKINQLKEIRNKVIAHNESIISHFSIELEKVSALLNFSKEIILIFSMAYYNSNWSNWEKIIEMHSFFIIDSIDTLKEKN